jgi:hypothetical protein
VINARLQHEAAMGMARKLLDVVASCVHPACHKDAYDEFVAICQSGIREYDAQRERMQQRLKPSNN